MELILENVGKIDTARIELNGITVIAGENNTGKSTAGKMLFCIFRSFLRMEEQVKEERIRSIHRTVFNFCRENLYDVKMKTGGISDFAKHLVDCREQFMGDTRLIEKELEIFLTGMDYQYDVYSNQEEKETAARKIYSFLRIEDDEIREIILKKRLEAEFGGKVGHVNSPEKAAYVCLRIKDREIEFAVASDNSMIIRNFFSLTKDIIYVDDPFLLDDLSNAIPYNLMGSSSHRMDLLLKIMTDKRGSDFSALDELVVQKKLSNVFEAMNEICDGELELTDGGGEYVYKTDKLKGNLALSNLSTGMKSFVILRRLLQNGSIDDNGIIILDEPEIHLHPEWQLKYAEIIVLIQKEFGMNILLNTHSPYFLNAIEVYADKYGIGKKCKYYLAEEAAERSQISDVSQNIEKIYEKLARPLQDLENMGY